MCTGTDQCSLVERKASKTNVQAKKWDYRLGGSIYPETIIGDSATANSAAI